MRLAFAFVFALWLSPAAAQSLSDMAPSPTANFSFATSGRLNVGEQLPGIAWSAPVTLSANLSTGSCVTAATADSVIEVYNWGTPIAMVDYAAGNPLPTITILSSGPLPANAFIYAVAPPTQDATLAGVSFTLAGR
jgi:hypothetical protein